MPFETSGSLTTTTKTADGKAVEIATDATVPTDTSISLTVHQDESGGTTADTTETISVPNGTTTISLSSFTDASGSSYWLKFSLSTSDGSVTPSIDSAVLSVYQTPTQPRNPSLTVNSNDSITFDWDQPSNWGGEQGTFRVQMERDGSGYSYPAGGDPTPSSGSTSETYRPNSDNPYDKQVGIDSSFQFRIRAENSAGESGWNYSGTAYTDPVPPRNVSVNRPDANTVEITGVGGTDWADEIDVEMRQDTGGGYGSWQRIRSKTANGTLDGDSFTITVSTSDDLQKDARHQFRVRHADSESGYNLASEWVYADYGNEGNVYFEDDFESNDLSAWWYTPNAYTSSGSGMDSGFSGADQGTYYAVLDGNSKIDVQLPDLGNESDVIVKAVVAVGSADDANEELAVDFWDGGSWQQLRDFHWEYNKQGWIEMTALVPDSYLGGGDYVKFESETGGGGDHYYVDRVVVSDILHEYTKPAAPTNIQFDTSVVGEITVSWDTPASFSYGNEDPDIRKTGGSWVSNWWEASPFTFSESEGYTIDDGEEYEVRVAELIQQDRNGTRGSNWWKNYTYSNSVVSKLPAPSNLSLSASSDTSIDISWIDDANNEDGHDVYYRESGTSTWNNFSNLGADVQSEVIDSLSQDTTYEVRIDNYTEHTTSQSSIASATTFLNEGRNPSTYSSSKKSSSLRLVDLVENVASHGSGSSDSIRVVTLTGGVSSSSNAISAVAGRTGVNLPRQPDGSYVAASNSLASRVVDLLVKPPSHLSTSASNSDRQLNFAGRDVLSEGSTADSDSIRVIDLIEGVNSYVTQNRSFAYNERTSLEVVDHNINWDDESSVWYTDWFTEQKILGDEDTLAIRSLVVPDSKKPAARVKIQYDSNGNGEVDEESEPIDLDDEQEVIEISGVPVNENGFYRIKIMEYSGYNSIYSLDTAIIR